MGTIVTIEFTRRGQIGLGVTVFFASTKATRACSSPFLNGLDKPLWSSQFLLKNELNMQNEVKNLFCD